MIAIYTALQFIIEADMSKPNHFHFYKHLITMECRKDIVIENDFINIRTRGKYTPFISKYKDKINKNKMRLAYLSAFIVFFNLNFVYDYVFSSPLYTWTKSKIERLSKDTSEMREMRRIDYRDEKIRKIGEYFMSIDNQSPLSEITCHQFASRFPFFAECQNHALDMNQFVRICMEKGITLEELPSTRY